MAGVAVHNNRACIIPCLYPNTWFNHVFNPPTKGADEEIVVDAVAVVVGPHLPSKPRILNDI